LSVESRVKSRSTRFHGAPKLEADEILSARQDPHRLPPLADRQRGLGDVQLSGVQPEKARRLGKLDVDVDRTRKSLLLRHDPQIEVVAEWPRSGGETQLRRGRIGGGGRHTRQGVPGTVRFPAGYLRRHCRERREREGGEREGGEEALHFFSSLAAR